MPSTKFNREMHLYIEDQTVDEYQQGKNLFFVERNEMEELKYALASGFEPGERREAFITHWDMAVRDVEWGTVDNVRYAMARRDDSDGVMIFHITAN